MAVGSTLLNFILLLHVAVATSSQSLITDDVRTSIGVLAAAGLLAVILVLALVCFGRKQRSYQLVSIQDDIHNHHELIYQYGLTPQPTYALQVGLVLIGFLTMSFFAIFLGFSTASSNKEISLQLSQQRFSELVFPAIMVCPVMPTYFFISDRCLVQKNGGESSSPCQSQPIISNQTSDNANFSCLIYNTPKNPLPPAKNLGDQISLTFVVNRQNNFVPGVLFGGIAVVVIPHNESLDNPSFVLDNPEVITMPDDQISYFGLYLSKKVSLNQSLEFSFEAQISSISVHVEDLNATSYYMSAFLVKYNSFDVTTTTEVKAGSWIQYILLIVNGMVSAFYLANTVASLLARVLPHYGIRRQRNRALSVM